MSGVRGLNRKRKYYKRCLNSFAWQFAPTGARQKAERFEVIEEVRKLFTPGSDFVNDLLRGEWDAPGYEGRYQMFAKLGIFTDLKSFINVSTK